MKKLLLSIAMIAFSAQAWSATEIRVAYGNQKGEPFDIAVNQWAEAVFEKSNGELKLIPFPSSQLGNETEVLSQIQFGAPIMTITSYSNFMDLVPDLSVIDAPYIADNYDQRIKIFSSDWFKEEEQALADKGYQIVIPNMDYGARQMLLNKQITDPASLKGIKIRVQNSPLYVATVKLMGAVPTPMGLGDVYPALQQGIVNGVENPIPVLYGGKFYEVAKYLNLTNHMQTVAAFVTGRDFWNKLSEEDKNILLETGVAMSENLKVLNQKQEAIDLKAMQDAGVKVIEVDTTVFKEQVLSGLSKEVKRWSPGLLEKIQMIINQ